MLEIGTIKRGKIHFLEHAGALYQAVSRLRESVGKERPGDQGRKCKDGIGNAVRRHLRQIPKKQAEYKHGQEGLQNGPQSTQGCLLVSDLNVTPAEKVEQFAVLPEFTQIQCAPPVRWLQANSWHSWEGFCR